MSRAKLITIAVIAVLVLIVILQNAESAPLKILFFTISMPMFILVLIVFGLGALLGLVLSLGRGKKDGSLPKG